MNAITISRHWPQWLAWLGSGLLLALAVATAIFWWLNTHTRIEHTIDLPPQGEAAWNPLYLLHQALRADGVDAQSRRHLQLDSVRLGREDTVVLFGDPRLLNEQEVARLLAWVGRGGHLLVRLPADHRRRGGTPRAGLLLESLGVGLFSTPTRFCHDMQMPGDVPDLMFCAQQRFTLDSDMRDIAWGSPDSGYALARRRWGNGSVDILAQLDFLTNTRLDGPQRAALARQLLAPNYDRGTVHLIYGAQMPPLWRLALEYGHMAWWPLLLALGAWLWMRMPRFGPLHPSPAPARRALLEHVQASGEHLYRYGQTGTLHAAMREAFLTRLQQRDPLAAALTGEAQYTAIAARTGLTVGDVATALNPPHPLHASDYRTCIARLLQMRLRL